MTSSKLTSSCFLFPNLLLSCLSFILFILSVASIVPIILFKIPLTSSVWEFLTTSCISLVSSFVGFYPQFPNSCFVFHILLLLFSLNLQLATVVLLFTSEKSNLISAVDPKESKLLARVEIGIFTAMLVMRLLLVVCYVYNCLAFAGQYKRLDQAEGEVTAKERSTRIAYVQEESMANAAEFAKTQAEDEEQALSFISG